MCFNSTLVQLKDNRFAVRTSANTCFNSTLVQLKGIVSLLIGICLASFNSTLVQLKVVRTRLHNDSQECFNSTLVQLKGLRHVHSFRRIHVSILP